MQTETPTSAAPVAPAEPGNDFAGLFVLIGAIFALGFFAGWGWAFVVTAIIFMIFMHELGHYLTARWTGMKVTEFFIGFGPRLWSIRKGATEYGVKGIPAGAYVRIIGMNNLDPVEPGDENRSYRVKSFPRKLLVVSAGSIMHFLMALVLLFALLVAYGVDADDGRWEIGSVSDASSALALDLEVGDRVLTLDGEEVTNFEVFGDLVEVRGGQRVEVEWERNGEVLSDVVTLGARLSEVGAAGFGGLLPLDRILTIDGTDVFSWDDVIAATEGRQGERVDMIVDPVGERFPRVMFDVTIGEVPTDPTEATYGFFGVSQNPVRERLGPIAATQRAGSEFVDLLSLSVEGLLRFFTPSTLGNFVSDTLGGGGDAPTIEVSSAEEREIASRALDTRNPDEDRILSIYGAARVGANIDFERQLGLLVMLNIFVGVFNMLPLPPLDGGHVAVATYERVRSIGGRRYEVDYARVLPLTYAVFGLLVTIGLLALFRDIIDPIDLG